MKNAFLTFLLIYSSIFFAQETIYLTNGDSLIGTLQEVDLDHVKVTRQDGKSSIFLSSMIKGGKKPGQILYNELKNVDKFNYLYNGLYSSYITKDGYEYKVGDKVKIGMASSNKTFNFITEGDGILTPIQPLSASATNQETEIKKIQVIGTKRTGFYVSFRTKGFIGLSNYSIDIENAIESKEVKTPGLSSDEALSILKKEKDKLDLGIISQADYDKRKSELIKYIK